MKILIGRELQCFKVISENDTDVRLLKAIYHLFENRISDEWVLTICNGRTTNDDGKYNSILQIWAR